MLRTIKRQVPESIKVLLYQFGIGQTLGEAARFAFSWILALAAFMSLAERAPFWAVICSLAMLVLFWRLKQFDILGKVFIAAGILRENTSQLKSARRWFLHALKFLRVRDKAYEGIARVAGTASEMRKLGQRIRLREWRLSAAQALLVARSSRRAGDLREARLYYEMADRLKPADAIKLELARVHLLLGETEPCLRVLESVRAPDQKGECHFLAAAALRAQARLQDALRAVNRAIHLRPFDPDYHLEKGKILEDLGHRSAALRGYSKSIRIHQRNPEACFRRGRLALVNGKTASGIKDLERSYAYRNTNTEAYLLAQDARNASGGARPTGRTAVSSWLAVEPAAFVVRKGETVSVRISVKPDVAVHSCRVVALEPFGGGLEVSPREMILEPLKAGACHELTARITAKRSSEVNLSRPWVLNLVFASDQFWANRLIEFEVRDEAEGRILLVLSEDHEPRLPRERLQGGGKGVLEASEVEMDLVAKSQAANALAEKHGLKWTHLLDAGTAVGLLRWAGVRSESWRAVSEKTERYYQAAYAKGHDCQIHLHLSGVPESYFFCYDYDRDRGLVSFNVDRKRSYFPGWQINSWANVTRSYGTSDNVNSRHGSLAHARRTVASLFSRQFPSYQPTFFRAGQWDLGANTAEREKSVFALRETGILADSSVAQGYSYYEPGFSFGKPVHQAAYFTSKNNPEEAAESLVDAGILEVVPLLRQNGRGAISPRDPADPVVRAYTACRGEDGIKAGIHIIMEIEHLAAMEGAPMPEGAVTRTAGDWSAMEKHFSTVKRRCPDLESVGASEAIFAWLDYFSPELVVRLNPPAALSDP